MLRLRWDECVLMIAGYFDESGTHDGSAVTTVGGFVSTSEDWARFDRAWSEILSRWGVSRLHMKHLAHFRGEYSEWDEPTRLGFLQSAMECIHTHCRYGCAVSVVYQVDGLLQVDARLPNAYSLAALGCMALVDQWTIKNAKNDPVSLMLECSDFTAGLLRHLEDVERPLGTIGKFESISTGKPQTFLGLQAADLIAYEQNKYLTECERKGRAFRPLRATYKGLQDIPHDWEALGAAEIGDILIELVLGDLRTGGPEEVWRRHPGATIEIDTLAQGKDGS